MLALEAWTVPQINVPALLHQLEAPTASAVARKNTRPVAKWSFMVALNLEFDESYRSDKISIVVV